MSEDLLGQLSGIPAVSARAAEPLAAHTPLRVGGPAAAWALVDTLDALQDVLSVARKLKVRWRVHWPLADWLVQDGGYDGLIIRPGRGFEGVAREGEGLRVGSAAPWAALAAASSLPVADWAGTIGGLFEQGEQKRLKGLGLTLRWLKGRKVVEERIPPGQDVPELSPSEILVDALLPSAFPRRVAPPPRAGQIFSAPRGASAGEVLQRAGLCGTRLRGWRLSAAEPGTIVQIGEGNCRDMMLLARGVVERVQRARGVELSVRIPVIGAKT